MYCSTGDTSLRDLYTITLLTAPDFDDFSPKIKRLFSLQTSDTLFYLKKVIFKQDNFWQFQSENDPFACQIIDSLSFKEKKSQSFSGQKCARRVIQQKKVHNPIAHWPYNKGCNTCNGWQLHRHFLRQRRKVDFLTRTAPKIKAISGLFWYMFKIDLVSFTALFLPFTRIW